MITLRSDADLSKIANGQIFLAFICQDCQRRSLATAKSYGDTSLDKAECKSCGHIRSGYLCECVLGDWLSVKPVTHKKD